MTLIVIVLAVILERVLSYSSAWRAHDLTGRWMNWVDARLGSLLGARPGAQSWALAVYILLPVFLVALLARWLQQDVASALLGIPLSLLILLACLGPRDLREQIGSYQQKCAEGESAAAESLLQELLAGPQRAEGDPVGRSPVAACFVQGHERWFAVLLWFFVLGPAGAVAYRMLASVAEHLRRNGVSQDTLRLTEFLQGVMAWPSARIVALLYAMAGSTDHALARWRRWSAENVGDWTSDAWPLLANVGLAALALDPAEPESETACVEAALRLIERALMIMLAVLALFTIGGWLQ